MTQKSLEVLCEQKFLFISRNLFLSKKIGLNSIIKIPSPKLIPYVLWFAQNSRVIHCSRVRAGF